MRKSASSELSDGFQLVERKINNNNNANNSNNNKSPGERFGRSIDRAAV